MIGKVVNFYFILPIFNNLLNICTYIAKFKYIQKNNCFEW